MHPAATNYMLPSLIGTPIAEEAGFTWACNHTHEHLGQMIAYARSNQVVPPVPISELPAGCSRPPHRCL